MPPKSAAIPDSQLVRMFDVLPTSLLGGVLVVYVLIPSKATFAGRLYFGRRVMLHRGYYAPRSLGMSSVSLDPETYSMT